LIFIIIGKTQFHLNLHKNTIYESFSLTAAAVQSVTLASSMNIGAVDYYCAIIGIKNVTEGTTTTTRTPAVRVSLTVTRALCERLLAFATVNYCQKCILPKSCLCSPVTALCLWQSCMQHDKLTR